MLQTTTYAIHTLQLGGDGATPTLLVWVTPLKGGPPVQGVTVELWNATRTTNPTTNPTLVAQNTTNAQGLALFATRNASGSVVVVVNGQRQSVIAGLTTIQAAMPIMPPQAAMYVAHPLVRPGEVAHVWGYVWQPTEGGRIQVPTFTDTRVLVSVANGFQSGDDGGIAGGASPYNPTAAAQTKVNKTVNVDPKTGVCGGEGMFSWLCV